MRSDVGDGTCCARIAIASAEAAPHRRYCERGVALQSRDTRRGLQYRVYPHLGGRGGRNLDVGRPAHQVRLGEPRELRLGWRCPWGCHSVIHKACIREQKGYLE